MNIDDAMSYSSAMKNAGKTNKMSIYDWRLSKTPQSVQVFKELFDAEGVHPELRKVMVPVGNRLIPLEDIIIGHYGMAEGNPTAMQIEAETIIAHARGAVEAIEHIAANITDYTTGKNKRVLNMSELASRGVRGVESLKRFLNVYAIHNANLLVGRNAIDTSNLKIDIRGRRLLNVHAQLGVSSDASMTASSAQVRETLEGLGISPNEIDSRYTYGAIWMNPEDAAGILGLEGSQEIDILKIASQQNLGGTMYKDYTLEEMMKAKLFDSVESDRSKLTKLVHKVSKMRFMPGYRDPIHSPGSGYQGILYIGDKIKSGYTVYKQWMSPISVADYDGDTLVVTALLQGKNHEAFVQALQQLIHLKHGILNSTDEALMFMDYTLKDYRANLIGGIHGLYEHGGNKITPALQDILNIQSTSGVMLTDILGLSVKDGQIRIAASDEALTMLGRGINQLTKSRGSRTELIEILELGVQGMVTAAKDYGNEEAATILHTLFGRDVLTKSGFKKLNIEQYITDSGMLQDIIQTNQKAAIQTFVGARNIGQYVNIIQGSMLMFRKYANNDILLERLNDRVQSGKATQAERMIIDIFAPNGQLLDSKQRNILVNMLIPIQEDIEEATIKALRGKTKDLTSSDYMQRIMGTIFQPDYSTLRLEADTTAKQQILDLYQFTGTGSVLEGIEATKIVRKFKGGMLFGGDAVIAKVLTLFTAFNSMTDEERGVFMEHVLGRTPMLPEEGEKAIYEMLSKDYEFAVLPETGEGIIYQSYKGINLSTALARNLEYVGEMQEIIGFNKYTPGNFKFYIPEKMYDERKSSLYDIATHIQDMQEEVKAKQILWEYIPQQIDSEGNVIPDSIGELRTGSHLFDPEVIRAELSGRGIPKDKIESEIRRRIRENLTKYTELEVDPGGKLGTNRRIKVKGFALRWKEAYDKGGEEEAAKIFNSLQDEIFKRHGLIFATEAGTGIQNSLSVSGGAIPSDIFHIHPLSPGLLGLSSAPGLGTEYTPVLHMAQKQLDALAIEMPHIKYWAQRLRHGRYLWEDPYMLKYMQEMDKITAGQTIKGSKLGLVNWLQYQAHKNTPGAFTEFLGASVNPGNAPALVNMAFTPGKGPSTGGAMMTPYGAMLKTSDQIYTNMKFANTEVLQATELMRLAGELEFSEGGISIGEGGISIDFSKAARSGKKWEAFSKHLKTMTTKLPRRVARELLDPASYSAIQWTFTTPGLRNLYTLLDENMPQLEVIGKLQDISKRQAFIQNLFAKIGVKYREYAEGPENFTFSWDVINEAPLHGAKIGSNIQKAMIGGTTTEWSDFGSLEAFYKQNKVSIVIGPDIKKETLTRVIADTIHTRWMQQHILAHGFDPAIGVRDGKAVIKRTLKSGKQGAIINEQTLISRFIESKKIIDDILIDIINNIDRDAEISIAATQDIINTFIEQVNKNAKLKTIMGKIIQEEIKLSDIFDTDSGIFIFASNITQQAPTGISHGDISVNIEQIARMFGTDDPKAVLEAFSGTIVDNPNTRMSVLKALMLHKAREIYGGGIEEVIKTARGALDITDDTLIKSVYAQQILQETGNMQYKVNQEALESIAEEIKNQKVMLIADDLAQLYTAHTAIRAYADDIVSFVGSKLPWEPEIFVPAKTFSLSAAADTTADWAKQIIKDAGLSSSQVSKDIGAGLPNRAVAGAVYDITAAGVKGVQAATPTPHIQKPMLSEIAQELLSHKAMPFLKSYWKPLAGVAAGLLGLGMIHRGQAARLEENQPEEYVPASQQTKRIPMMRDNRGYGANPSPDRRVGVQPQHPGTMQIEQPTDIIINEEDYVDEHRLRRMLNKHLR